MTRRASALCVVLVCAAVAVPGGQGDATEQALKLAHQTLMSAITSGNPAIVMPILHQNGLGFFRDSQNIARLGGGLAAKEAIPTVLADLGRFTASEYEAVYRVAGTTGVVCMATGLNPKKGEFGGQPRYIRSTWVYAHLDGTWRLLSWHTSDIPLKK